MISVFMLINTDLLVLLFQNMPGSVGLPVNVQVVTLPWRDELCLRVMEDLQEALKEQSTPQTVYQMMMSHIMPQST